MAATSDTDQEIPSLWQFVRIADYRPPTASVKVVSENWFATLRKRFRPSDAGSASTVRINNLEALSHQHLARIAPEPDWRGAVASLDGVLEEWLAPVPSPTAARPAASGC